MKQSYNEEAANRGGLTVYYFGGCSPGDFSQSLIWEAVSACLARLRSSSRGVPGGASFAAFRKRSASSARRSSKVWVCLRRCGIARPPWRWVREAQVSIHVRWNASLLFGSARETFRETLKLLSSRKCSKVNFVLAGELLRLSGTLPRKLTRTLAPAN